MYVSHWIVLGFLYLFIYSFPFLVRMSGFVYFFFNGFSFTCVFVSFVFACLWVYRLNVCVVHLWHYFFFTPAE